MNTYDPEAIDRINDSVDLVEYVGQYIELEQRGKDYYGHCPLHEDNTPSFSINSEENYFYCFSCHRGGGIIDYLKAYEGLGFEQAVEKASRLAGVDPKKLIVPETIAYLKKKQKEKKMKEKAEHPKLDIAEFKEYEPGPAQEWLDEGISEFAQRAFGVCIDTKWNRIIYPVFDNEGNLINFKGRTRQPMYKEMSIPKYISKYPVGTLDYLQGLNVNKASVIATKEIILFESLKSVMKVWDWDYQNAASLENHDITDEQLQILIQLGVDVVIALDSDMNIYGKQCRKLRRQLDVLKHFAGVYIVRELDGVLGGPEAKNSPADCGREVWEYLYENKYPYL